MSTTLEQGAMDWHKSSYSHESGTNCVEQGLLPDGRIAVRDTKQHGTGPVLGFTREEWNELISQL